MTILSHKTERNAGYESRQVPFDARLMPSDEDTAEEHDPNDPWRTS